MPAAATARRVYSHLLDPREHPDYERRAVKPPTWETFKNRTQFTCLRGFGRRRRSDHEPEVWVAAHSVVEGGDLGALQIETDRARFIGRGRSVRDPAAISDQRPLSNTTGTVLDPVFASRRRMRIRPGGSVRIAFWTFVGRSRDEVIALADRHREPTAFDRVTTLAWSQGQIERHHMGLTSEQANQYQRLASHLLYANPALRAPSQTIERGAQPASALWAHGISGDLPIVLARIDDESELPFVRELLQAHEYWQRRQFDVDLVILNEKATSYVQDLQVALESFVRIGQARRRLIGPALRGNVFVLRRDLISADSRNALLAVARVDLVARRGALTDQLDRLVDNKTPPRRKRPLSMPIVELPMSAAKPALEYSNDIGGFGADGREYVVALSEGLNTPAPWLNVIANPQFGFQVSAEGSGYTWSESSRENQLTEWSNDPVTDQPSEVMYIRDDETGDIWTPTPSPIRRVATSYLVRHGQGYSRFEHNTNGVAFYLLQYVAKDDPIKISRLTIRNASGRTRRLTITGYAEWLLGSGGVATSASPSEKSWRSMSEGTGPELFDDFKPLFDDLVALKAFRVVLGADYYAALQPKMAESERLLLFIARVDGAPAAGLVTSMLGDTAVYLLAASNDAGRRDERRVPSAVEGDRGGDCAGLPLV